MIHVRIWIVVLGVLFFLEPLVVSQGFIQQVIRKQILEVDGILGKNAGQAILNRAQSSYGRIFPDQYPLSSHEVRIPGSVIQLPEPYLGTFDRAGRFLWIQGYGSRLLSCIDIFLIHGYVLLAFAPYGAFFLLPGLIQAEVWRRIRRDTSAPSLHSRNYSRLSLHSLILLSGLLLLDLVLPVIMTPDHLLIWAGLCTMGLFYRIAFP
ncbi:MAG: hypothetical protein KGI54_09315 [Pseudomonadota bacterium]|nr:hypothetical protein [Pseudomonadota bacterium]